MARADCLNKRRSGSNERNRSNPRRGTRRAPLVIARRTLILVELLPAKGVYLLRQGNASVNPSAGIRFPLHVFGDRVDLFVNCGRRSLLSSVDDDEHQERRESENDSNTQVTWCGEIGQDQQHERDDDEERYSEDAPLTHRSPRVQRSGAVLCRYQKPRLPHSIGGCDAESGMLNTC